MIRFISWIDEKSHMKEIKKILYVFTIYLMFLLNENWSFVTGNSIVIYGY